MPAKDTGNMAKSQMGTEKTYGADFAGKGDAAYSAAFPELKSAANNPTGYTPSQLAAINTANQQGTGGGVAAVTGQADLMAGRTRNPGAFGAGLAQATRQSGRDEAQRALGIQEANANLAQQKQQRALSELGGLYGTNVKGLGDMMGASNNALQTYGQDTKSGLETGMGVLTDLSQVGLNSMKMASMA